LPGTSKIAPHSFSLLAERLVFPFEFFEHSHRSGSHFYSIAEVAGDPPPEREQVRLPAESLE